MTDLSLFWPILVPAAAGVILFAARNHVLRAGIACLALLANLAVVGSLFAGVRAASTGDISVTIPWAGFGMDLALRLGTFGAFILLAAAGFALLITLYSWRFMQSHPHGLQFYLYLLLSVALINGAVMADHLVVLLFFWEGLLGTLFGMIAIGQPGAWKSATKALIIAGIADLCMMLGIALVGTLGRNPTLLLSELAKNPLSTETALGATAFILLMIGATAKAGSMPFHSWIPDAAVDAPLPFMAFMPASLEKLLGIYFLTRITQGIFHLTATSWLSTLMMVLGAATILLAVAMALIQKDYKRLLSYHAISQVGYMILGVGTALPIGIVGGVFHMINHAMYKSCLFLTAGNIEHQTGTTDLRKLGGLGKNMPITFICFIVAAASISGFPLTNGFYSKELIYEAAKDSHILYYLAAVLGTVLTAASFLKLGHAVYLGRREAANDSVREAPASMLVPMGVIAAGCLLFGLYNALPLQQLVEPSLPAVMVQAAEEHVTTFAGLMPREWSLAGFTCLAIGIALLNHLWGVKRSGSGLGAVDHIHHAPLLGTIYRNAERGRFDPYVWIMNLSNAAGYLGLAINVVNDWIYEVMSVGMTRVLSWCVRRANNGNYSLFVLWSLVGAAVLIWFMLR